MIGCEDGAGAVDDGELVVPGGQSSPLLEGSEGAFDDVAGLVGVVVVGHGPPATRTSAGAVGLLVAWFGDHRDDLAAVAAELNTRPRKTLGWQTPAALFATLAAT